jgi:hypothetical protein
MTFLLSTPYHVPIARSYRDPETGDFQNFEALKMGGLGCKREGLAD